MARRCTRSLGLFASLLIASGQANAQSLPGGARSQGEPGRQASVTDYAVLDNTPAVYTNFNVESVRPMVTTPDGAILYALNTHANFVAVFHDASGQPAERFATPLAPVAIALWDDDLIVACAVSRVLVRMQRSSGRILSLMQLGSEPQDLVIGDLGQAFVSCAGIDGVVQVDLETFERVRTFSIPSKRPRFLARGSDGAIYVAPTQSGNNSTIFGPPGNESIVDLADPSISPSGGLPDIDLYRLDPASGAVQARLAGMGTLLFGHGQNPATGMYWMLNVESFNQDSSRQSAPALNGSFAQNRLSLAALPAAATTGDPDSFVDLDDSDPQTPLVQIDPEATLALPYGLTFSSSGFAFVSGSASDVVSLLSPDAERIADFRLPAGSIPRHCLLSEPDESLLFVYCWGTNQIQVYSLTPFNNVTPLFTLDLGLDPAPGSIRAGRQLFYDAGRSQDNRLTCAHCHPAGWADGLAWDLSDTSDPKGPMVTQTLHGLSGTFPYHWRGENDLAAFNSAFTDLLGGPARLDESPGGEFDQLREFLLTLTAPANPLQGLHRRIVDDPSAPPTQNGQVGGGGRGQGTFRARSSDGTLTCGNCHDLPLGTTGDSVSEQPSLIAGRTHFDGVHLTALSFKRQPVVPVNVLGQSLSRPVLGFGLQHAGRVPSLASFLAGFGQLSAQDAADLEVYLEQFDNGLAPAVHFARLLDSQTAGSGVELQVRSTLLKQAHRGWLGVVAFGTTAIGGTPRELRWTYRPASGSFQADDPLVPPMTLGEFAMAAESGLASNVFMGVPPGNETRIGIDLDADGLPNGLEQAHATDPFQPDTDGDGWPDGYEAQNGGSPNDAFSSPLDTEPPSISSPTLLWNNARVAKFTLSTNELTRVRVDVQTSFGLPRVLEILQPSTIHTFVLQDLIRSTPGEAPVAYTGTVRATDLQGNSSIVALPPFQTDDLVPFSGLDVVVLGNGQVTNAAMDVGGNLQVNARFRIVHKAGGPPPEPAEGRVVIARVLVNGEVHSSFTSSRPTSFAIGGAPYTALDGPFVISQASRVLMNPAIDGWVDLDFHASGLAAGDAVRLSIVGVLAISAQTYDPAAPDFPASSVRGWSLPDTAPEIRNLAVLN